MEIKKKLIICQSFHHGNTMKIAKVMADKLNAETKKPSEVKNEELNKYDLIGFGSGIYDGKHHNSLLDFVDKLPNGVGKKTFIFSTSGVPVAIFGNSFLNNYSAKAHATLKNKLKSKNYKIICDFICPGFNTDIFLKYFGGVNKNRPNEKDLASAKKFASKTKSSF